MDEIKKINSQYLKYANRGAVPQDYVAKDWRYEPCGMVDCPDGLLTADAFWFNADFVVHVETFVAARVDERLRQEVLYGLELPRDDKYGMQPYALVKVDNNGVCYRVSSIREWRRE